MLSRFLKGGEYFKNSVTLISGTTISQLIPLVFAPVLARIYPPDNYGVLGIYMAVSSLFGLLATLQYSNAIILAETDNDANDLLIACFVITGLVAICTLVIMLFLHYPIAKTLSAPETAKWLLLSPLSVLFVGANATLSAYTNRIRQYKTLALNRMVTTLISALLSLSFGLAIKSELGLMVGYIGGQMIGTIFLLYSIRKNFSNIFGQTKLNGLQIKQTLKKYISFPKFVLFSEFINNFINYIPVFLLSKLTGPATVGLYNMSTRMLGIPITTVSTAIGEVFRQKAAKEYNETGSCKATFLKTFKALSLISIVPFVVLIFWGGDIFGFIFGEKWRQAGMFAQILGVMFYFRFIVSPLTYLYYIAGKQKEDFILHLLMLLLGFLSILAAWYFFGSAQKMLLFYALAYVLIYVIYFIRSLSFTEKK